MVCRCSGSHCLAGALSLMYRVPAPAAPCSAVKLPVRARCALYGPGRRRGVRVGPLGAIGAGVLARLVVLPWEARDGGRERRRGGDGGQRRGRWCSGGLAAGPGGGADRVARLGRGGGRGGWLLDEARLDLGRGGGLQRKHAQD